MDHGLILSVDGRHSGNKRAGWKSHGCRIGANLRKNYPRPLLYGVLFVVSVANVFNLGADIGAMGAATQLLLPGKISLFIVIFGVGSLVGILLVPYSTYAKYLKWLTISLFAYVGVAFFCACLVGRGNAGNVFAAC